jgi:hypothetical protein
MMCCTHVTPPSVDVYKPPEIPPVLAASSFCPSALDAIPRQFCGPTPVEGLADPAVVESQLEPDVVDLYMNPEYTVEARVEPSLLDAIP